MDGIYTPAIPVDHVDIHAGQRYSILVTMNHPMDNYDIKITQVPGPGPSNGKAILHYEGAEDPTPLRTLASLLSPLISNWIFISIFISASKESPYRVVTLG